MEQKTLGPFPLSFLLSDLPFYLLENILYDGHFWIFIW